MALLFFIFACNFLFIKYNFDCLLHTHTCTSLYKFYLYDVSLHCHCLPQLSHKKNLYNYNQHFFSSIIFKHKSVRGMSLPIFLSFSPILLYRRWWDRYFCIFMFFGNVVVASFNYFFAPHISIVHLSI